MTSAPFDSRLTVGRWRLRARNFTVSAFIVRYRSIDDWRRGLGGSHQVEDGITVRVSKLDQRVCVGPLCDCVSIMLFILLDIHVEERVQVVQVQQRVQAPRFSGGPPEHDGLVFGEVVTVRVEPPLFDVHGGIAGGQVDKCSEDVVMDVMEPCRDGTAVPLVGSEGGQPVQEPGHLGRLGWWPSAGPVGAGVPELQDGFSCLGTTSIGIRRIGRLCLIGGFNETGGVVGKPARQSVVGAFFTEFGENAFPEGGDRVNCR